jgi:hypothetical protein
MSRAVLLLPGGGAYGPRALGSLPRDDARVGEADALRQAAGLPTLTELDSADAFEPSVHAQPIHALPLAYLVGVIGAERAEARHEVVAVTASSIGWYAALAVAGALSFGDGLRLVHEIASVEQQASASAQLAYPSTDAAWRPHPVLRAVLDAALAGAGGGVAVTQELGPYVVLGGSREAVEQCRALLRPVQVGDQRYPRRISGPLRHDRAVAELPADALQRLAALGWRRPRLTLIDGRGARHTPWATDPGALRDYTLGELPRTPYRFAMAMRVALREYAPEVVVALGPGRGLANVAAQLIVAEGYHGLRTRAAFEAEQAEQPLVRTQTA